MNLIEEFLSQSNYIEDEFSELAYKDAKKAWGYLSKQKELTIPVILKTHKMLSIHSGLLSEEKGYFRKCRVWIGGREGLEYEKIQGAMNQLVLNVMDVVNNGKKESTVFLEGITKEHHVKFEKIHPFVDYNGRCGRLVMLWERLNVGLPIEIIYANERYSYYEWFQENPLKDL